MKIILIGYGKMGQTIERLASDRGHEIVGIIDINTSTESRRNIVKKGDIAIEFSHPDAAFSNIVETLKEGIPVISGTTGWLHRMDEVKKLTEEINGSFLYASNFSIGVNLMFVLNEYLARLMNGYKEYEISVDETHHIHKKDAPSGTALTLTNAIIDTIDHKNSWSIESDDPGTVKVNAYREGEVYGRHKVRYKSSIDTIEIIHDAHTRDGFALGALIAAEWLIDKTGVYTMKDLLGL